MQCSNCGSHYRMRDLACPYCGTENALGRLWQKQRTEAELSYEKARVAAGKKWSPYIYDRVVSRVMVVEFLLILFTIFVLDSLLLRQEHQGQVQPRSGKKASRSDLGDG